MPAWQTRPVPVVEIRALGPGDWAVWREVRLRALADAPHAFGSKLVDWQGDNDREERWRERFDNVAFNAVAVADGRIVGTVGGMDRRDATVELISMWVAPEERGIGVGQALIAAVVDWAAAESVETVVLAVRRGNRHAIALYGRAGFQLLGSNPENAEEDLMARSISARTAD